MSADSKSKPSTGTDSPLRTIQYATGMALVPFAALHLTGHFLAAFPPYDAASPFSTANAWIIATRELYHQPVLEKLGGLVLVVHLGIGVYRYTVQRKFSMGAIKNSATYWTRASGLLLALYMAGHVYYTRIAPLQVWGDSNLIDYTYVTYTIRQYGPPFAVYYMSLGAAGVIHLTNGFRTVRERFLNSRTLGRLTKSEYWATMAGVAAVSSGVLALTGYFFPVHIVAENLFARLLH
ncbi:hypothetical protein BCR44DRAFT_67659 [Catenaria anguillulae PL171]|uniref:Mitochondrial adapter protein MCP1 transmembrane domain-containing protein n=1 Tax=Catenaria anguillulae PL171 TaxID=765915 RepID=A0A1Y2GZ26_9FUNG|nr:hypothetical protein BCR44DRAFT_67659 [Catenaria anguillulae PL171]